MSLVVRPLRPTTAPTMGVRVEPQYLHWQVGKYIENLSSGPGGIGRKRVWVSEREGIQHNTLLETFYDSLIPTYGFIGSSQYCAVGSGATEPHPFQTTLAQPVARSNALPSGESNSIITVSNGVYDIKRSVYFSSSLVGNKELREWGFGPTGVPSDPLMVRELFRNDRGDPVTLVLAPNHNLKVTYVYRITVSPIDTQSVTINVEGYMPVTGTFGISPYANRYSTSSTSINYAGIDIPLSSSTTPQNAYGDLIVAENIARGTNSLVASQTLGINGVSSPNAITPSYTTPNTISTTNAMGTNLSFSAVSGRKRTATFTMPQLSSQRTIRAVALTQGYGGSNATTTVYVLLDQPMVQDTFHQIVVGGWTLSWGS